MLMSSRPRIAILGLHYTPEHTGNAPYTSGLASGLARRGLDVRVTTAHPHYPDWEIRDGYGSWASTEQIEGVPVKRLRHYVPSSPRGVSRLLSEVSFGLRLIFERTEKPDVVLTVSPALFSSAIAAFGIGRKTPLVVWVQDIYSLGIRETGGNSAVAVIITKIESWLLRRASKVVVIHDRFADYMAESLSVPRERIEVIRNWTHLQDRPNPPRGETRSVHGWRDDETVVLHAGNMGLKQGLENVVEAARVADKQAAPVRFVLLGNGSERDALVRLGAGIERLDFLPALDDAMFSATLDAADILLVNEKVGVSEMAVPSKLTSYFAATRPVVAATDPAGITASEINAAEAGVIVNAGEPAALLDAVLGLAADAGKRQLLGWNGRVYRETVLTADTAIEKFSTLLTGLTNSGSRRSKSGLKYPVNGGS